LTRRSAIAGGFSLFALSACHTPQKTAAHAPRPIPAGPVREIDPLFDDIAERAFNFFWDTAEPGTGLVPDRWPKPPFASIAAIGFGLTAYAIGVERGFVTREAARERVLMTLKFLHDAPQGPEPSGKAGYQGFFYHFLNFTTGHRYGDSEISTVDTALLLAGVLFVANFFDLDNPEEKTIRTVADDLYLRVNWPWAAVYGLDVAMGWSPELDFIRFDWRGYNEAMLVYILGLGSPTFPISARTWQAWTSEYDDRWGTLEGQTHLTFGPMFGHQYSAIWIDYRGIFDGFMYRQGFDYFENSRRAALAQRAYAIRNPLDWRGYGPNVWGLTASDGPANVKLPYRGEMRQFASYAARGVGLTENFDDGTLAPTAVISSLPFAPEIVVPAVKTIHAQYGRHIYGKYGFVDSFNPSFDYDVPLAHGRRVRGVGWVATDYLGIDQGPIIAMIENYRSELVWRVMKRDPYLRHGLLRAGFEGGWLNEPPPGQHKPVKAD
jgi:hypothetical protein